MRLRKLVLASSLLLVCFLLSVHSANADTIVINDTGQNGAGADTYVVNGVATATFTPTSCLERSGSCTFTLTRPGFTIDVLLSTTISSFNLAEGLPIALLTPVSDSLDTSVPSNRMATFTFLSDSENNLGNCGVIAGGCAQAENGQAQLVDIIVWVNNSTNAQVTDTISIQSETDVPEPASLILFGSGLAIAGGFLRRRRRLVTPSA